jgi:hypothetical protein
MFNNSFARAVGIVAICYLLLQTLGWGLDSLAAIASGFSFWIRYTLVPHAWQFGLAAGAAYLIMTTMTSRERY